MATAATTERAQSADGTTIAFERSGVGPGLILVDAASGYREFGPMRSLAEHLADDLTVIVYDRRGRGESSDTPPYSVQREVDDLVALIEMAGGTAFLYGYSSGALLAIQAALNGLNVTKLALLEPPIGTEEDRSGDRSFTEELARLIDEGRRRDAVVFFQRSIGVPDEMIDSMEPSFPALEAIAHTLVYDCLLSDATGLEDASRVTIPTLVIDSQASSADLTGWAASVAAALPHGSHRSLPGEWHGVAGEVLAPVLVEFFKSG